MKCDVRLEKDSVIVESETKSCPLRMSITKSYCRLFETTQDQSRDYVDETVRWIGDYPSNFDAFSKNLMHYTAARRRQYGFEK